MVRFIFAIMILCSFTILFANTIQINPYTLYNGEINISIDNYHMEKVSIAQNRYDKISIKDFDYTSKIGYPYLPAKYFLVAIPKNTSISIEVDLKDKIVLENINLMPTQNPKPDCYDCESTITLPNSNIYNSGVTYPQTDYSISQTMTVRGIGLKQIAIYPIKYIPKEKKLIIYKSVKIYFSIPGIFQVPLKYKSESMLSMLKNLCINGNFLNDAIFYQTQNRDETKGKVLVFYDSFTTTTSQLNSYINWIAQKGYSVQTKNVTNIPGNSQTISDSIYNYIKYAYENWSEPPEYVTLIGDVGDIDNSVIIPTRYGIELPDSSQVASDYLYTCVDGNDILADLSISRILADDTIDSENYFEKMFNYEKTIDPNSSYYSTYTAAAYFQDENFDGKAERRFAHTSEEISNLMESKFSKSINRIYYALVDSGVNPTYWSDSTLVPNHLKIENGFTWQYNTNEIISAIQNGTFLIMHRDHGSSRGWSIPSFSYNNVNSLSYSGLPPVVLSLNCLTGKFDNEEYNDYNDDNYFVEVWLRSQFGTVSFIGSSRVSYSGFNDALGEALINFLTDFGWDDTYNSFFDDFESFNPSNFNDATARLSDASNYAKLYTLTHYDINSSSTKIAIEEFNVFGDPLLRVWMNQPNTFTVSDQSNLNLLSDHFSFTTNTTNYTATLFDFSGNKFGQTNSSDFSCSINITQSLVGVDSLLLTITKKGFIPYQDTLYVKQYVEISGNISGTFQKITYYAIDNITVPTGENLTIPNGAVIKFNDDKKLTIKGLLTVQDGDDITYFTTKNDDNHGTIIQNSNSNPQVGDWQKLYFYNANSSTSQIFKTKILYAENSLQLFKSKLNMNNCDIGYCENENIKADGYSWSRSDLNIQNSYIRYGTVGIYSNYTNISITNCNFDHNSEKALFIKNSTLNFTNSTIQYTVYPITISGNIDIQSFSNNTFANNTYNNAINIENSSILLSGILPGTEILGNNLAYLVTQNITTSDLEIKSGAILKFLPDISFTKSSNSSLQFTATSSNPIIFTSYKDDSYNGDTNADGNSTPDKSDWKMITLNNDENESLSISNFKIFYSENGLKINNGNVNLDTFEIKMNENYALNIQSGITNISNCLIDDTEIGIKTISCDCTIDNSEIKNTSKALNFQESDIILRNNNVHNNEYPVYVYYYFVLDSEDNNTFQNNTYNGIYYYQTSLSHTIYSPQTLGSLPHYNYFPYGASIKSNDCLTIEPSSVLIFSSDTQLSVPNSTSLICEGSQNNEIQFLNTEPSLLTNKNTAFNTAKDYWKGIKFYSSSSDTLSALKYLIIKNAEVAIDVTDRNIDISHCSISNCENTAIKVNNLNGSINYNIISNCTNGIHLIDSSPQIDSNDLDNISNSAFIFENTPLSLLNNTVSNSRIPIKLTGSISFGSFNSNTFSNNDYNAIQLAGNISGNLYNDLPAGIQSYYIENALSVANDDLLTIHSGVTMKFSSSSYLTIYGGLDCQGTSSQKIIFTSFEDDEYGGDITGNGNNDPSSSLWNKIYLNQSNFLTMNYCLIRYAQNGIYSYKTNPEIHNSKFEKNTNGIYLYNSLPTINNSEITENDYGIYVTSSNGAVICGTDSTKYNLIYNNSLFGIYNSTPSLTIDARYNWWGSSFGPSHSSNSSGDGDTISDGILYNPWKHGNGISSAPQSPKNVIIQISNNDVILTWDEVTQDTNGNPTSVTCYKIFCSDTPYGTFNEIGESLTNSYTHTSALNNEMKFYKIKAINSVSSKK